MPTYEASATSSASPEDAFATWIDVASWSDHDHIESASIDGAFRPGATITVKAKGFPKSTPRVTGVEPHTLWVDESSSPGIRMTFHHLVEPTADGTKLTERAEISGPLAPLLGPLLRRRLVALFEASTAATAKAAEDLRG